VTVAGECKVALPCLRKLVISHGTIAQLVPKFVKSALAVLLSHGEAGESANVHREAQIDASRTGYLAAWKAVVISVPLE
jgi:hypothetical protein